MCKWQFARAYNDVYKPVPSNFDISKIFWQAGYSKCLSSEIDNYSKT